ncbi:MAG: 16S rRNA (cytidine(1402)-2'-O)-methyltransferase [Acidobacteria bacterium]|nr:16S rRNA (cytidine(1402)-2'-O)-methyltransferase [Acidobacteriota bacterium]
MTRKLTLAATPIGNLGDASARLIETLQNADLILAEDTRHSQKLLSHFGISKPIRAFHDHSTQRDLAFVQKTLEQEQHIVLISDAGMPLVSDPGFELVQLALQIGCELDCVPGPNAPITALALSGLPPLPFAFLGFVPQKAQALEAWLAQVSSLQMTTIHFESPNRIQRTLAFLSERTPDTPLALCREMTKKFQTVWRGTAQLILEQNQEWRGEMVLVIGAVKRCLEAPDLDSLYQQQRDSGLSHNQAIKTLAQRFSLSKKQIQNQLTTASTSVTPETEPFE